MIDATQIEPAQLGALNAEQLHALVLGLPWQRVGEGGVISVL